MVFCILAFAVTLAVVSWNAAGQNKSAFVTVVEVIGLRGAADVINFVVLVAALSAIHTSDTERYR